MTIFSFSVTQSKSVKSGEPAVIDHLIAGDIHSFSVEGQGNKQKSVTMCLFLTKNITSINVQKISISWPHNLQSFCFY